ncbi:hypothetical protein BH20PSE1_BH20PSE1_21790 [soil metagenome]
MLQKKICMLGFFGVGKTSLVRRYVCSVFSDTYLTTVGVKIDKTVTVREQTLNLLLWDIAGADDISALRISYLRGAVGYLLVPMARGPRHWRPRSRCKDGWCRSSDPCRSWCC